MKKTFKPSVSAFCPFCKHPGKYTRKKPCPQCNYPLTGEIIGKEKDSQKLTDREIDFVFEGVTKLTVTKSTVSLEFNQGNTLTLEDLIMIQKSLIF